MFHTLYQIIYFIHFSDHEKLGAKEQLIGSERHDHFVALWINRNARRKRPGDLLLGWSKFLNMLKEKHCHQKASIILHTDPVDHEGPNLFAMTEQLGIKDSVIFSTETR